MNLNLHLKKHINTEGFRLVSLIQTIETKEIPKVNDAEPYQNIPIVLDIGEVSGFKSFNSNYLGEMINYKYNDGDYQATLDETNFRQVKKLLDTILKDQIITEITTSNFVIERILEWLFETHKNGKTGIDLANYLTDAINEAVKTYDLMFPILYLTIPFGFKIGEIDFFCYSEDQLNAIEKQYLLKNTSTNISYYKDLRPLLNGRVFARYRCKAEFSKAKIKAIKEISLAVDVLKITSETVLHPNYKLFFDIDNRVGYNAMNNIFYNDIEHPHYLCHSLYREIAPNEFNQNLFARMNELHLDTFSSFISEKDHLESELERLIKRSIISFAKAISNIDHYQRIIEIFSILESLLVLNNSSALNDTVCKYCVRLVTQKVDDRLIIAKILKDLYAVRSAFVHHDKAIKFETNHLSILQRVVNGVIYKLIIKTKSHTIMQTILDEIDSAILAAG